MQKEVAHEEESLSMGPPVRLQGLGSSTEGGVAKHEALTKLLLLLLRLPPWHREAIRYVAVKLTLQH